MEIRGRIIQALQLQSGTSAAGRAWKKQEFVLETFDQYPRKVVFTIFGDKVDQLGPQFTNYLQNSTDVTVSFDLESRSFVGRDNVERWSTEVRPWKIVDSTTIQTPGYGDPMQAGGFGQPAVPMQQPYVQPQPAPVVGQFPAAEATIQGNSATDDLPF